MRVHSILHFLTIFVFITFSSSLSLSSDTITSTQSLTSNQTLVSPGQVFELGFFTPGNSNIWFLGIWYKNIRERTYVWVANKDNPLTNPTGILKVGNKGNIIVLDQDGTLKWSSNETKSSHPAVAKLLDTGNLVVKEEHENSDNYLWQSFDYPTDTLLPGMKLGWDFKNNIERHLTAWKSSNDPSTGDYSFKLDFHGFPEIFLIHKQDREYRSGPWVGTRFSGVPEMKPSTEFDFVFVTTKDEVFYSYSVRKQGLFSRLVLNSSGQLWRYTWLEDRQIWTQFWSAPKDRCDDYLECGPFGICDTNASPVCKCAHGFMPKKPQAWQLRDGSDGCVRKTELDCQSDGFLKLTEMKLPETSKAVVNSEMGLDDCRDACLRNCSCSGYANSNVSQGGSGCAMWIGELLDMREYAEGGGQDLYVRVSASDLDSGGSIRDQGVSGKTKQVIEIVSIAFGIGILLFGLIIFFAWKRKVLHCCSKKKEQRGTHEKSQDFLLNEVVISSKRDYSAERKTDEVELPLFDYDTIAAATDNFSDNNKLGQGGFGCVYKGRLIEGQEVAVKRLSRNSGQGVEEFKNEVRLIARLQHRNLVQLLGCCVETNEKILIYEYMENRSLDSILFSKTKGSLLDWQRRFNIISSIARGLLYLHQDSRFRIIHRDLKASNILLDGEMNPKISDFGMARIFGGDETEASTRRVVGTYGYMSPEYAMDGVFSVKSDVFSFGVLVLEIVSGKKNRGFYHSNSEVNLLGHAWRLWKDGKGIELLDTAASESYLIQEVLRCIQVGLLCVQERSEDRPTMSTVVLMLGSESATMAQPKQPGFCLGRNPLVTDSSSSIQDETFTINQVTVTTLDAR